MRESKSKKDQILSDIKHSLYKRLGADIEQIILFGSRSRGDANKYSDYDILLLVKKYSKELENQADDIAYEMLDKYGALVIIFVSEKSVYDREKDEPLFSNIHKEGMIL